MAAPSGSKVFVSGIPKNQSEQQVKAALSALFENVEDIVVLMLNKKTNKGTAFVHFKSSADAAAACAPRDGNAQLQYVAEGVAPAPLVLKQTLKDQPSLPPRIPRVTPTKAPTDDASSVSLQQDAAVKTETSAEKRDKRPREDVDEGTASMGGCAPRKDQAEELTTALIKPEKHDGSHQPLCTPSQSTLLGEEEGGTAVVASSSSALHPKKEPSETRHKLRKSTHQAKKIAVVSLPPQLAFVPPSTVIWVAESAEAELTSEATIPSSWRAAEIAEVRHRKKVFLTLNSSRKARRALRRMARSRVCNDNATEEAAAHHRKEMYGGTITPKFEALLFGGAKDEGESSPKGEHSVAGAHAAVERAAPVDLAEMLATVQELLVQGGCFADAEDVVTLEKDACCKWRGAFKDPTGRIVLLRNPSFAQSVK